MKTIKKYLCVAFIGMYVSFQPTLYAQDAPQVGSAQWHFETSKAIGSALADSAYWNMSLPYFRDIGEKTQDWSVLLMLSKVELQQGNYDASLHAIQRALAVSPENPRLLFTAAQIFTDSGDTSQAIDFYEKTLSIQPNHPQAVLALARLKFAQGDWNEVIALYEPWLSQHEPTSEPLVRLAVSYENLGNVDKAERYLLQNVDIHPNRAIALVALERFYTRQGKTEQAKKAAKARAEIQKTADDRNLRQLQRSSR